MKLDDLVVSKLSLFVPPLVVSKRANFRILFSEAVPQIASELLFLFLQMHDRSVGGVMEALKRRGGLFGPSHSSHSVHIGDRETLQSGFRIVGGRRHGADTMII